MFACTTQLPKNTLLQDSEYMYIYLVQRYTPYTVLVIQWLTCSSYQELHVLLQDRCTNVCCVCIELVIQQCFLFSLSSPFSLSSQNTVLMLSVCTCTYIYIYLSLFLSLSLSLSLYSMIQHTMSICKSPTRQTYKI